MEHLKSIFEKIDFQSMTFWLELIRIFFIVLIVWFSIKMLLRLINRYFKNKFSAQWMMLAEKFISYSGFVIVIAMILNEMGFDLSAFLGAAGILGVAIGFASQTSISNIISGFFLISEKPFEINDIISIGNYTGVVMGIDMLSVKLKTFDNRFVRIPNENLIKTEIVNISRYPIRRLDIEIGVAYKEDPKKIFEILKEIAKNNEYSLEKPEPFILFKNFGSSALEFIMGLWFEKTDYINLKNSIMIEMKERFDQENIEIPFPHLTVYTGSETKPFPVDLDKESLRL